MAETVTAAKPAKTVQSTEYVVLARREFKDDKGTPIVAWVEAGDTEAPTRLAAAQHVAGEKEGIWRPVPVRSWSGAIKTYTEKITRSRTEIVED